MAPQYTYLEGCIFRKKPKARLLGKGCCKLPPKRCVLNVRRNRGCIRLCPERNWLLGINIEYIREIEGRLGGIFSFSPRIGAHPLARNTNVKAYGLGGLRECLQRNWRTIAAAVNASFLSASEEMEDARDKGILGLGFALNVHGKLK